MSDGGWIPSIAGTEPRDTRLFVYDGYIPPSYGPNSSDLWQLPDADRVAHDIEARGGIVDILVSDICESYADQGGLEFGARDTRILLGAIIMRVRSTPQARKRWDEMRQTAEQMSCVSAESRMNHMIEDDAYKQQAGPLIKFLLERRDHRFSKTAAPVNEEEENAIKELHAKIYGKKQDQ